MFIPEDQLYQTILDAYLYLGRRQTECGYLMQILEKDYADKRRKEVAIRLNENVIKDLRAIIEKLEKAIAKVEKEGS